MLAIFKPDRIQNPVRFNGAYGQKLKKCRTLILRLIYLRYNLFRFNCWFLPVIVKIKENNRIVFSDVKYGDLLD